MCIYINPNLPIHPTTPIPWYPHICSLHLYLYFCFVNKIICTNFLQLPRISINIQYLLFSFWFTSFRKTVSRPIHTSTFLFMVELHIYIYIYHIFFILSSVNEHLGYFHVLAIVNSTALNFWVHLSFWIMAFSRYVPSTGIAGSYGYFYF